ncbi:MAG: translesion error-prone DNA polymerase V autoproteolytic subunit [Deltaproteobacteria bacterium]|nr:translesion error-prone DNA polymerase V autoproteolytic subunit [Deltaproteobacteria bacterium]
MPVEVQAISKNGSTKKLRLVLYAAAIPAGFPSPAEDYIDKRLDLNEHLIKHPAATFFVRVAGHSMINAGIHDGDTLIVDRALEPAGKKIVIAVLNGEMTVKRLRKLRGRLYLMPENESFPPIEVTEGSDFQIWGVVSSVIHPV